MSDYYAILGVHHEAELVVIKAAYRAMVKKYHPDTFEGEKAEAEEKIREITQAYETLSDTKKRAKYDKEYGATSGQQDFGDYQKNEFYDETSRVNDDWTIIIEVHPEAENARQELAKLSKKLALVFQSVLIDEKLAHKAINTAKVMEVQFLKTYFGPNKKLQNLAREALMLGKQDLAKEINKKVVLLGSGSSEQIFNLYAGKVRAPKQRSNASGTQNNQYEKNYKGYGYVEKDEMLSLVRQPPSDNLPTVVGLQYSNIGQLKFFVDKRIQDCKAQEKGYR